MCVFVFFSHTIAVCLVRLCGFDGFFHFVAAGSMTWIKAFYPDPQWRKFYVNSSAHVVDLTKRAVDAILSNFKIPVRTQDNLSVQGKVAAKYLPHDRQTWGVMTGSAGAFLAPHSTERCLGWSVDLNCKMDDWEKQCSRLDRSLLQSIRAELGSDVYC